MISFLLVCHRCIRLLWEKPDASQKDVEVVKVLVGHLEPFCHNLLGCRTFLQIPEEDLLNDEEGVFGVSTEGNFRNVAYRCVKILADLYQRSL